MTDKKLFLKLEFIAAFLASCKFAAQTAGSCLRIQSLSLALNKKNSTVSVPVQLSPVGLNQYNIYIFMPIQPTVMKDVSF